MTKYVIRVVNPLYGEVRISGFKNDAASILPGLLPAGQLAIKNRRA